MTEAEAAKILIKDIGKQLNARETCPKKDFIVKLLRQAASAFSTLDQAVSLKSAIKPLRDSLVKHSLLQHKDKDVRLLVAICCCEIIRVLAPNPDFSDAEFRLIYKLFISMFEELAESTSPYFSRRAKVLETVAKLKFCVLMIDTDDDLVFNMFNTFFTVVREEYPQSVITAMVSIMTLILKEKVSQSLLDVILQNLLKEGEGTSPASSQLAISVIQNCAEELEPFVCGFLTSCISDRDATGSELKEFYHEIIFKIFQCSPQMLLAVIPTLTQELLTDQVDVRIKAVNLIGRLFALPGHHIAQEYRPIFIEFLNRFSDKSAEVRIRALLSGKALYMTNPSGMELLEILSGIESRLLDFDDRVRLQAVSVVCDIIRSNLQFAAPELILRATERLRDKKVSVRKRAFQKLLEIYRDYCTKCSAGIMTYMDQIEQIPCRILMLCYDKDCKEFRPQSMELVIAEDLFPSSLPFEGRIKHWISFFSLFSAPHVKALSTILYQKGRFQTEMKIYLTLRRKEEENSSEEVKKSIESSFAKMSLFFPDPSKAEECLRKVHIIQDNDLFSGLSQLLDEVTFENTMITRDGFLKKIGDKHPHFGFLQLLSAKCSFNIFSSEHVNYILNHLSSATFGNKTLEASSVKLIQVVISMFPTLLKGSEYLFQMFLRSDTLYTEELIQMLAKAGPHISIELSDIYPSLEKACLEGTRALSKIAVSAIAALVGSSEQFVYSKLCKRLVDSLYNEQNIPTVLQSLGILAQHSPATFETQYEEITKWIIEKVFQVEISYDVGSFDENSGCSFSCKVKVYGLKALVRSFLPHQQIHVRRPIDKMLDILSQMLLKGDFCDGKSSSEADKSYIRLAAAKAVLRLSRRWDFHISPQIFRFTVLVAKDSPLSTRGMFLDKVHKLLKKGVIPSKYACAFAFAATDSSEDVINNSLKYMADFIRVYTREARMYQNTETQGFVDQPAYMVVFLIHVLAHDICFPPENCQDEDIYTQFCSPLVFTLRALVNVSFVNGDMDLVSNAFSYLRSILRAIKKAEDALDAQITTRLHILADFGISIINALDNSGKSISQTQGLVPLPSSLYKLSIAKETEQSNLHFERGFDANMVTRMVHSIESQISRPASTLTKRGRKGRGDYSKPDVMKSSSLNLTLCKNVYILKDTIREKGENGKENFETKKQQVKTRSRQKHESPTDVVHGIVVSENSESITGIEQFPSSCDSVFMGASLTQKEYLPSSSCLEKDDMMARSKTADVGLSNGMPYNYLDSCSSESAGIKNGRLIGQRIKLWSPIDECYQCGTVDGFDSSNSTYKISCDNGAVEALSLESDNWETINDHSLRGEDSDGLGSKYCDPQKFLSSQNEIDGTFRDDAPQQQECLTNKSGSFFTRRVSHAVKRRKKEEKITMDESAASEVTNVKMDVIAERTRSRRKV